jgi:hypothetical protein
MKQRATASLVEAERNRFVIVFRSCCCLFLLFIILIIETTVFRYCG